MAIRDSGAAWRGAYGQRWRQQGGSSRFGQICPNRFSAGPHLLAGFHEKLIAYAETALERLHVEVRLNTPVEEIDADGVATRGERIDASVGRCHVVESLIRVRRVSQLKSCGGDDFAPRLHG